LAIDATMPLTAAESLRYPDQKEHMRPTRPRFQATPVRVDAKLLAGNIPSGKLAQAKGIGVVANALEAEAAAQGLKIEVIRFARARSG